MAVLHWTHPHTDSSSTLFDYGNVEWWKRSNFFCNVSVYLTLKVKVVSYFLLLLLIIMSCSFSVTTSNDSFHLPSSYCLVKNVIRSTNCSASEIDFIAKESSMVTSSSSLSISFRCSWSLWHPFTVSMAFWQDSCRQAMFLTSIDGCDVTTSYIRTSYIRIRESCRSDKEKSYQISARTLACCK